MTRSAEIEREFGPVSDAESARGVSFDGEHVWVATGTQLVACDANSGKTTRTLDIPADAGTAFDGTHLYQVGAGLIRKIEPSSGRVVRTIPVPSVADNSGLCWAEGSLWLGQNRGRKILRIDPENGKVLSELNSNRFVTGVSFCEGELWHATLEDGQSELRQIDRESGEVLDSVVMPPGGEIHGLESDGKDRFFCGSGKGGKIRVVKHPRRARG